ACPGGIGIRWGRTVNELDALKLVGTKARAFYRYCVYKQLSDLESFERGHIGLDTGRSHHYNKKQGDG
ncbi:MAG TPA: hypothetical protein VFU49_19435, partial [Ktedonobacteraceae bacterium]|nr:hypothetical protein [Ktedonobacteraceae bacterium]